jgi:hypothetical protein
MVQPLAPVSDREVAAAFSGAAPAANRFVIQIGHPGVRISFLEALPNGEDTFFRSAVTLHPIDAISLYRVLKKMLEEIENEFVSSGIIEPGALQNA